MEPIEGSETSAFRTQTPGKYPKENTLQKVLTLKNRNHLLNFFVLFNDIKLLELKVIVSLTYSFCRSLDSAPRGGRTSRPQPSLPRYAPEQNHFPSLRRKIRLMVLL
jgi:hypothetical protein